MTADEENVLAEYVDLKKCPANVKEVIQRLCEKIKAARPNAVMFHTTNQLCFRTPYSKNGNGIEMKAFSAPYFRISLRKPRKQEFQKGKPEGTGKCFYRFFIVLEPCKNHPDTTDADYEELVLGAALDSYDQTVEEFQQ